MGFVEPSDEEVSKCSFSTCIENRRLAVRNDEQFDCKHLQSAREHILEKSLKGYANS